MVSPIQQLMTAEEFADFTQHEENRDKRLEWLDGEMFEVTANQRSSKYGMLIGGLLVTFVLANDLGDVTGADGGYMVGTAQVVPDVAFVSRQRQPETPDVAYNPLYPDFAVEVISPSDLDNPRRISKKLQAYQAIRIPLLWVVYPHREEIDVYVHGELVRTAGKNETLDGGDVLPGFTFDVKLLFK